MRQFQKPRPPLNRGSGNACTNEEWLRHAYPKQIKHTSFIMSTQTRPQVNAALFESVRSQVIGYNDACLVGTKDRIAEELDMDPGDLDELLVLQFHAERCACCGHWYDVADCNIDNGYGGFECRDCTNES
jgi:hypothetical protein